jgi:hypothetical protein
MFVNHNYKQSLHFFSSCGPLTCLSPITCLQPITCFQPLTCLPTDHLPFTEYRSPAFNRSPLTCLSPFTCFQPITYLQPNTCLSPNTDHLPLTVYLLSTGHRSPITDYLFLTQTQGARKSKSINPGPCFLNLRHCAFFLM